MPEVFIRDMNGRLARAGEVTLPSNRNFRDAWVWNGPVMEVDMPTARWLYRDRVKTAEKAMAAELLPRLFDAELGNNPLEKAELARLRGKARNSRDDTAIDAATTPEDLLALWDDESLGSFTEE